jgi:tripartite-type tricarboxylate transporter receptor subunit TctC
MKIGLMNFRSLEMKTMWLYAATLIAGSVLIAAKPALAKYPDKPYTVIVGWAPGGGIDTYTRVVSKYAQKYLGERFVIQYKKGGGGRLAYNLAAKSKDIADGYTLLSNMMPNYALNSLTYSKVERGYAPSDFVQLGANTCVPSAFFVRTNSPIQSVKDLVAYAKKNPGKVTVGVAGARSGNEAFRLIVDHTLGIKTRRITYGGGSESLKALLGGEVMVMSANAIWLKQIPHEVRALFLASDKPYKLAPHTPTLTQLGYDITDCLTRGIAVPKGVPERRIEFLRKGLAQMAQDEAFQNDLEKIGLVPNWWDQSRVQTFIQNYIDKHDYVFKSMSAR